MNIGKHVRQKTHIFCGYDKLSEKVVDDLIQSHDYKELCQVQRDLTIELIPRMYHLIF